MFALLKKNFTEILDIIFAEKKSYTFKPEAFILFFGFLICVVASITTPNVAFFGHKSISIFDIWTFVHIATGSVLGFFIIGLRKFRIHHPIILLLLLSSTWEIVEHYIEISGPEILALWFAGEESLFNRLIADQMSLVIGFAIIKYKPKLFPVFLILALGVLIFHVIVGDSMYFFR